MYARRATKLKFNFSDRVVYIYTSIRYLSFCLVRVLLPAHADADFLLLCSLFYFLALLDCVSRAIAVARESIVVRKTRFLGNYQAN